MLAAVGDWDKATSRGREIRRSVGPTGDGTREQGRLPQMFYTRAGDETGDSYP